MVKKQKDHLGRGVCLPSITWKHTESSWSIGLLPAGNSRTQERSPCRAGLIYGFGIFCTAARNYVASKNNPNTFPVFPLPIPAQSHCGPRVTTPPQTLTPTISTLSLEMGFVSVSSPREIAPVSQVQLFSACAFFGCLAGAGVAEGRSGVWW